MKRRTLKRIAFRVGEIVGEAAAIALCVAIVWAFIILCMAASAALE